MENKFHNRNEKILDYIEINHLLDDFNNLEVSETSELKNIYWDFNYKNRQHFVYAKNRLYLFHFNGLKHNINITIDEIDKEGPIVLDDNIVYKDPKSILKFLREDIYKDSNLIPFLCILLNIDVEKINTIDFEKEKEIENLKKNLSRIENKIIELDKERKQIVDKLSNIRLNSYSNNTNFSKAKTSTIK